MEETIRLPEEQAPDTIPALCAEHQVQLHKPKWMAGMEVGEYSLLAPMMITASSELWFGKDDLGDRCVVKFTQAPVQTELIETIRTLTCDFLVPILDCGYLDSCWYEVYPYYKNGHLKDILEEDVLKTTVLPGVIQALECLHGAGIIHNDIKPENIFWDEDRAGILLGDYGCVTRAKERPRSYTPAYTAPELLLNDVSRRASDWASVGLLLAKLTTGVTLVEAKSTQEALRIWEKGIFYSNKSYMLQQLVNGMIHMDPRKRLGPNAARKWCGDASFGAEERTAAGKAAERGPVTVTFENPPWIAADIDGLLKGIELHWKHSIFLFQQARMDRFLSQFDRQWVSRCKEYRKMANPEDALVRLTMEMSGNRLFVWRGISYENLLDLEETWESGPEGESDIVAFLQKGHVVFYLRQCHAALEQVEFVQRLQEISRVHPFEACAQLFQALRGNDGMAWEDTVFQDLNDVVLWLESKAGNLDEEIDRMFHSKRFEAWLAYQGLENILDEIRRKCDL